MNSEDRYEITWLIRRLFRAMGSWAEASLQGSGITAADRAVLEFLYPDQALPVPEIAARYNVTRQHVQVTVNRLLDKGLVETRPNPAHKRSPHIRLAPSGHALFRKIRARDTAFIDRLFTDVPATHQRTTRNTLRKLLHHLNEGEAK